ncbi:MAG: hypothetical protein ACFE8M_11695 [Candidatus Hermodarchaeota archaeon]
MSSKNILKPIKVKTNKYPAKYELFLKHKNGIISFNLIDMRESRIKSDNLQNTLPNSFFKQIKKQKRMDAKIKHRKKREGD